MTDLLPRSTRHSAIVPDDILAEGVAATSPTYVYDLARIRHRCRTVAQTISPPARFFFATMANDHPSVISCIRDSGLGVFVNSPSHLRLALDIGFDPAKVIYAASNMVPDELEAVVGAGVNLVLDSMGQLEALGRIAPGVEVGLRVNVGTGMQGDAFRPDPSYRFGVLPSELPDAVEAARRVGIRIVGAHSYFGTDIMIPSTLVDGLAHLGRVVSSLPDLRYLDVGGGFGVPETFDQTEFDLERYAEGAARVMAQLSARARRPLELYVEPGRYLVATSGFFFVKVVDCKVRPDRAFVGTTGSVATFPRPLLYPDRARHPCNVVGAAGLAHPQPVYVCGNSTYSQDFLARAIELPLPPVGATLVFHNAGAYGRSMISNFLGRDHPEEIVLDTGDR